MKSNFIFLLFSLYKFTLLSNATKKIIENKISSSIISVLLILIIYIKSNGEKLKKKRIK